MSKISCVVYSSKIRTELNCNEPNFILLLIERAIRRQLGHAVFATREYGMTQ